jgi:cysteine desulfurase
MIPRTALVSVLHGNNETGIVHALKDPAVPLHVDAVQTVGHVPLGRLPFTYLTFSAHKFGGPRGVGGIVVRDGALLPQIVGGGQEKGARGGTENVAGIAAAAVALEAGLRTMDVEVPRLRALAKQLQTKLLAEIPGLVANSNPDSGLPGLVNVSLPDLSGETVVQELDLRGFAISAGAACGSGKMLPSRIVLAMGRSKALALGTLRISMGRLTTDVVPLAKALVEVVKKQRELQS